MVVTITQARDVMADSLISMLDFTITIPLTDLTKRIHTNSFIKLNQSLFNADYLWEIYKAMGKTPSSRNTDFREGYWYVQETEVNYKNNTMKLKLLALPSVPNYDKTDMNASGGSSSNVDKTSTDNNSSGSSNVKLKKNKDLSKKEQAFLEDIVKKAIGTKNTNVARAKACYKYYQDNHVYKALGHGTAVRSDYARGFKSLWNQRGQQCGPGAATLYYMFKCIGLSPQIMNGHNHYWIRVKIDGKTYYCDQAGAEGSHNVGKNGKRRIMSTGTGDNVVWGGAGGGSVVMG